MARKSPALYELIGERGDRVELGSAGVERARPAVEPKPGRSGGAVGDAGGAGPVGGGGGVVRPAEPDRGGLMLKPGSAVRVPVGYLYVAGAVAVVLVFGSFMMGYQAAKNDAERARQESLRSSTPDASLLDPLAVGGGGAADGVTGGGSDSSGAVRGGGAAGSGGGAGASEGASGGASGVTRSGGGTGSGLPNAYFVGGDVADPRESGLNYWVVATQAEDEAQRIARFLSARGIGTVVVRSGRDYQVTSLRGFRGNPANDSEGRSLRERILDLGRVYRMSEGGVTDFSDMYARKL